MEATQELAQTSDENMRRTSMIFSSNEEIDLWTKLKLLFMNKCFAYLTIASFFRFFGGYSLGFLSATFFLHRYPDNDA